MAGKPEIRGQRYTLCLVADEGAVERFADSLRFLQIGLIDEPVDVILVLPDTSRPERVVAGATLLVPYRVRRWPFDVWTAHRTADAIRRLVAGLPARQPMVVHSASIAAAPLAARLAEELGAAFFANVASVAFPSDSTVMAALDRATVLILPASQMRDAIQRTRLGSKSVEVIRPGVATEKSAGAFGDAGQVPTVVFAGSLAPDGGADVFLRGFAKAVQARPDVLGLVAGKGSAESDLRKLAGSLKIRESVTFTGRLEHLRTAMMASDIFCAPRRTTMFREEPIYAMAGGLAMIVADGLFCDGLADQQNSAFIQDGNEAQLAEEIGRLLDAPEHARRLGAAALATAETQYGVSRMVEEYARAYRQHVYRERTLPMAEIPSPRR
ncbi:MAG TPA: glycosyltransferase [Phycisphaerae bacterium]|nr:glycosyltransferase [Phycisphaerae bacterium]